MPTISIHQLHEETERWIRSAHEHGEVKVIAEGAVIVKIVPQPHESLGAPPYFSHREVSSEFEELMNRPLPGTDVTELISRDRDHFRL